MIRPPPRSTLFPTRRSSDLSAARPVGSHLPGRHAHLSHHQHSRVRRRAAKAAARHRVGHFSLACRSFRSEEHTSELQSLRHLVCRLLLEKKKKTTTNEHNQH